MGHLQWSGQHYLDVPVGERRASSVTYLELACVIDTITKGTFGPPGASFRTKAALVEYGVKELLKVIPLRELPQTKTNKFLQPRCCGAADAVVHRQRLGVRDVRVRHQLTRRVAESG